jgi:hypothetical protein
MLGNDYLDGGYGDDRVHGHEGDDHVVWGNGNDGDDEVFCSTGYDEVLLAGDLTRADALSLSANGARVLVDRSAPSPVHLELTDCDHVRLDTAGGNDSVDADALAAGLTSLSVIAGDGNDVVRPGRGRDLVSGGPGTDRVEYTSRTSRVLVSLDNVANDGAPFEGDDVRSDVEQISGGRGNDVLFGNGFANVLRGYDGRDYLDDEGGAGDIVLAGAGDDTIRTRDALRDIVEGGPGFDRGVLDVDIDDVTGVELLEVNAPKHRIGDPIPER